MSSILWAPLLHPILKPKIFGLPEFKNIASVSAAFLAFKLDLIKTPLRPARRNQVHCLRADADAPAGEGVAPNEKSCGGGRTLA